MVLNEDFSKLLSGLSQEKLASRTNRGRYRDGKREERTSHGSSNEVSSFKQGATTDQDGVQPRSHEVLDRNVPGADVNENVVDLLIAICSSFRWPMQKGNCERLCFRNPESVIDLLSLNQKFLLLLDVWQVLHVQERLEARTMIAVCVLRL